MQSNFMPEGENGEHLECCLEADQNGAHARTYHRRDVSRHAAERAVHCRRGRASIDASVWR